MSNKFTLNFPGDTLAFVVLSQPSMFEKTFLPYLKTDAFERNSPRDPIDQSIVEALKVATTEKEFPRQKKITIIHDFELFPNRRPKVLVQTAAHVAGAVQFFQQADVRDQSLLSQIKSPKIYPVCVHPSYGGWFAIRAVLIMEELEIPDLAPKTCDLKLDDSAIAELLTLYNDHWEDWRFRDVIESREKYSSLQKDYFAAKPSDRKSMIEKCVMAE